MVKNKNKIKSFVENLFIFVVYLESINVDCANGNKGKVILN